MNSLECCINCIEKCNLDFEKCIINCTGESGQPPTPDCLAKCAEKYISCQINCGNTCPNCNIFFNIDNKLEDQTCKKLNRSLDPKKKKDYISKNLQ
jgi:hypothetical protein